MKANELLGKIFTSDLSKESMGVLDISLYTTKEELEDYLLYHFVGSEENLKFMGMLDTRNDSNTLFWVWDGGITKDEVVEQFGLMDITIMFQDNIPLYGFYVE